MIEKILWRFIVGLVFPLLLVSFLIFFSSFQTRPFLICNGVDWIARAGLSIFIVVYFQSLGKTSKDMQRALSKFDVFPTIPYNRLIIFRAFLGAVGLSIYFAISINWILITFLPDWMSFRNTLVCVLSIMHTLIVARNGIEWVHWFRLTHEQKT